MGVGSDESHDQRLVEQFFRLTVVGPFLGSCLFDVSNMSIKQSIHLLHAVAVSGGCISGFLCGIQCWSCLFVAILPAWDSLSCLLPADLWGSFIYLFSPIRVERQCRVSHIWLVLRRDAGGCVQVAVPSSATSRRAARLNGKA